MQVTVTAAVQLLGQALELPISINNLQLHALMRITAQPLMPAFPYVGAVGVSLLEPPHVDFELPVGLLGGLDAMALPLVRGVFRLGARLAARQLAVFPR